MDAEYARRIGSLEGKIDLLLQSVESIEETSSTSRQVVRDELRKLADLVTASAATQATLEARVAAIEPFVKKAERWEQRGVGALAAVGMISGVAGTFFGDIKAWLMSLLQLGGKG